MGTFISESQSSFVTDRQILYGILIANDVVAEAYKMKKNTYYCLKLILKRFMTPWIGGYLDDVSTATG